jgi:D-alanyl-D-alanine carboxypeptidase
MVMSVRKLADWNWGFAARAVAAAVLMASVAVTPSEAAKKKAHSRREATQKARPAGGGYSPPFAALVVDAKTGAVLYSDQADAVRHPASLTKVMTLYILFEELERGTLNLDTPLKVSANGARQAPSKLGLVAGDTIRVEDAIKALVTKSANDVAYTIGENISGSEAAFADRMTRKARALGMSRTVYVNASGLPDDRQVTSATDLAILGRSIQDRFPRYFPYFSTRSFVWRGRAIGNHNRLVMGMKGVDGIKTGFVRASGFNLLTSAKDNGRSVVGVVLGGTSGAARDATMRKLITASLPKASSGGRNAPLMASTALQSEPVPVVTARAAAPVPAPMPRDTSPRAAASTTPTSIPMAAVLAAAAMPMPKAAPQRAPQPVAETPVAAAPAAEGAPALSSDAIARRIALATAMTASAQSTQPAAPAQQEMRWVVGSQGKAAPTQSAARPTSGTTPGSARSTQVAQAQPRIEQPVQAGFAFPDFGGGSSGTQAQAYAEVETPASRRAAAVAAVLPPRDGWQIQIGATDDPTKAAALIDRANPTVSRIDSKAQSFTETVARGEVTLYRARFAGLSESSAQAACKALKKSSLSCFALKN